MRKFLTHILAILAIPAMLCAAGPAHADDALDPMFDLGQDAPSKPASSPFEGTLSFDSQSHDLVLRVDVAPGSYVYCDSIGATATNATLGESSIPEGKAHRGRGGKERQILDASFTARFKVQSASGGASATAVFQGCDSAGVCYPPAEITCGIPAFKGDEADSPAAAAPADAGADQAHDGSDGIDGIEAQEREESASLPKSFVITLLVMLVTGMGLDLTPCVLPLLGVFSAMIMGAGHRSLRTAIMLNLSYLVGLVAAYTALGWIIAAAGMQARAVFASPAATMAMAAVFLIFALDSAGVISIKVPALFNAAIQKRLSSQRSGAAGSAFVFGALSGLLTTPCTSAPLAAALLYVAQDGSAMRGTLMFMAVGLGMGLPLALAGIFGARMLPKPGAYSVYVRKLIALPLVFAAALVLMPLAGWNRWFEAITGAIMMSYFVWITMSALHVPKSLHKALASALYGLCTLFAVYSAAAPAGTLPFEVVTSEEQLSRLASQSPLFVTFGASWCENCHVMDEEVYSSKEFTSLLNEKGIKGVRIDLSNTKSKFARKMIKRFGINGVPAALIMKGKKVSPEFSGYDDAWSITKYIEKQAN
ncbi:MAG: cytochrome c biogenesis protein CcdA [Succinivibrio sp.]